MTTSVYHAELGVALNLTEPDLGQPSMPELWEALRADKRPVPERQLQCMECMQSRPHCPEWMFLTERSDGVRFASHFNRSVKDHPSNESDQHKAFKERIATAAELGGHAARLEDRAEHGKRRTDVLVRSDSGLLVGWEVQLSPTTAGTARKRARIARGDGITPMWATVNRTRDFINQVPWALTDDMPWKQIADGRELLVRGGVRTLAMQRCDRTNPRPCPARGRGRCGQLHGSWVSMEGLQLDKLVRVSAAGEFVPIIVPGKRVTNRWWVRTKDRDLYADSVGGLVSEDDIGLRKAAIETVVNPRPLETECHYGQDTGYRSSPAPIRDDGSPVDAVDVTVADRPLPPSPRLRMPSKGICGAGAGPCGASPARFYACGWRCDTHAPGATGSGRS